jgi:hypothetical protein
MDDGSRQRWATTGWAVRVVVPDAGAWPEMARQWPVAVRDGGYTEVAPGTLTAVARW